MSIEKIKNWVVVMFENRSFDNLLGHLEHIDAEDGVRGKTIELPYPGGIVTVPSLRGVPCLSPTALSGAITVEANLPASSSTAFMVSTSTSACLGICR